MSVQPLIKLEKPILDFHARQVPVFQEVIENFEEKCCEEHQAQRQKIAQKARRALRHLMANWDEKELRESRQMRLFAATIGVNPEELTDYKNNITYHKYALKLAEWCKKLTKFQKSFQRSHEQQLLTMRMPPGSHEVSERQLKMNFQTALTSYMVLCTFDSNIPLPTPTFVLFMDQIIVQCRTHSNPAVYHMVSLFIEHVVQDANRLLLQESM